MHHPPLTIVLMHQLNPVIMANWYPTTYYIIIKKSEHNIIYITCEDSIVLGIVLGNMEWCRDEPCGEGEAEVEVVGRGWLEWQISIRSGRVVGS